TPWTDIGGPSSGPPSAAVGPDGRLAVVMTGKNDDKLYVKTRRNPTAAWTGWTKLGEDMVLNNPHHGPTIVYNTDGRAEVFAAKFPDDYLIYSPQFTPDGAWSVPARLSNLDGVEDAPRAALDADGRMDLFIFAGRINHLYTMRQTIPGGAFGDPVLF